MRHLKNLLLMALLPLVGVVLFASCEKDPDTDKGNDAEQTPGQDDPNLPEVEKDATIVLKERNLSAPVSGGTLFMEYVIDNAHQGEKISVKAAEDWVSDFNTSLTGAFSMKVAPNTGTEERETLVTVSYRYAEDVTFTVKQKARIADGFSVEQVTGKGEYYSYTVNVTPDNKNTPYIVMSASLSYIEECGLESDEALFEDDYLYFEYLGSFHGMTAAEVMQHRSKMGDQKGVTVGDATPGEKVVFYCYYFDYDSGSIMSDIYRFNLTVEHPAVTPLEEGYFTFDYDIVGPRVHTNVTSSTDVDYYYDIMTEAELLAAEAKGYTKEEYIKLWWAKIAAGLKNSEGYTEYDIVSMNTCQGTETDKITGVTRNRSEWSYDLLANTNYYIFAFNFDENALCVTVPQMVKITTGSVEPSDNQISLSVEGVTAYRATVLIDATYDKSEENYRHAYVTHIATKEEWNSYGINDAARMNYIKNNIALEYMWGDKGIAYSNIEPNTEYVAYAFGLYGGVVTTQLWTVNFTTKSDAPGEVDFETLADLGYYDPADLAQQPGLEFFSGDNWKGYVVVPIDVTFTKKNHGDWFFENYDWTGRTDYYDDEQYRDGLIWQIEQHGSYPSTQTYVPVKMDGHAIIVGIVCDVNGQYSKLYKKEFKPNYDGCGDATVFAEWYNSWTGGSSDGGAELQSLVIEAPKAEAKAADIIEVDASQPRIKAQFDREKASQMTLKSKEATPEVTAIVTR